MSERIEEDWKRFIKENVEMIPNFEDTLVTAFTAGWFAGNEAKQKEAKK